VQEAGADEVTDQQRYPLAWPVGWKRTPAGSRRAAMFSKRVDRPSYGGSTYKVSERLTIGDALNRLNGELRRLGASQVVISSNLRVRVDGLPYADQAKRLDDPGVAVYFKLRGQPRVLACDKWNSAADNMAAIAGHIEAIRACDRYGVGSLEQAFAGYAALPANTTAQWWTVFGVEPTASLDEVEDAYRRLARAHHPDAGGSHEGMARLNEARDRAREALQ
jgi:hypothetical protein